MPLDAGEPVALLLHRWAFACSALRDVCGSTSLRRHRDGGESGQTSSVAARDLHKTSVTELISLGLL